MLALTLGMMVLSVYLYTIIPKGFFPQQDTGRISGSIQAAEDISFAVIRQKLTEVLNIISNDPAVETVTGFSGPGSTNSARMFIGLSRSMNGG
jgi:multidrug efflux pump